MERLAAVDWKGLFTFDIPVAEIVVRGSVIFLALFLMLRVILKRQAGTIGISDLLVIVLIADAAQNGMAGAYQSLPSGLLLVGVLIFWNYTLEWLAFTFPRFDRLLAPPPLPLVRNGRIIPENMRKEFITRDDLMSQLRLQGVDALDKVRLACLEGDGKLSVITRPAANEQHTGVL